MTALLERLAADDAQQKRDEKNWALLQPRVEAGAVLTYRDHLYWLEGVGSISEQFAFGLVRRQKLWRTGPMCSWPVPELGLCPEFPPASAARVIQLLFYMFDSDYRA